MIELNKEYTTSIGTIIKPIEVILEKVNGYRILKVLIMPKCKPEGYIKEMHELHLEAMIKR